MQAINEQTKERAARVENTGKLTDSISSHAVKEKDRPQHFN
jgi:uncharacterized surface protein with fasciclin (FAS1) repeats